MISVEMEDVLAVLQLCKPYIIGIIAALVIGIVIMIACHVRQYQRTWTDMICRMIKRHQIRYRYLSREARR